MVHKDEKEIGYTQMKLKKKVQILQLKKIKKVIIGPPESMSNKKNTIDPETMIEKYGADAVRWFILSDSPPEKDIQWSDTEFCVNKFLQKLWNQVWLLLNIKQKI